MNQTREVLERLSSGVEGLDTILGGGLFQGGMYLIQGTPGTGKTTLANQICFHRTGQGDRALYVTLLAEYHSRMAQYISQMSFYDESKLPDGLRYLSGFNIMRTEGLEALQAMIRREIIACKISVMVIDGLIAAQRVANSDQAFNQFIHELQGLAQSTDCTVILVASADRHSHAAAEHTMVDGILQLTDQSFGWDAERVLEVTKIRGTGYLRGKHAYKITPDGVVVYPRTEALLAAPSQADHTRNDKLTSGLQQLDRMLGGGLPVSSPTVIAGPSGIGKTTFGLHFLTACSPDEPGLMFGFYETPPRIQAKAQQVCQPLLPLIDSKVVRIMWQPPSSEALDAYAERLLTAVKYGGVRRLFLDGLGALNLAPTAQQRMSHFLPALTNELRVLGVTTIYCLEAGNAVGPATPVEFGEISVVAENLLLLRYVERGAQLHRLISILKVRDSDFDPMFHEFTLTAQGPAIEVSSRSAERIMAGVSVHESVPKPSGTAP